MRQFSHSPPLGAIAFFDHDQILPGVEVVGGRFNMHLLHRQLDRMGVSSIKMATASFADKYLVDTSLQLGFEVRQAEPEEGKWMRHILACEIAWARVLGPRNLVLIGATAGAAQAVRALRARGASVVAMHWPGALALDLVQAANRSISLSPEFILDATIGAY